jgi:pimeloyl-ACP methyl ester carboxylesterase
VAGHDIGGMVAYAYARLFPEETRGIMILDVPLPGLDPWPETEAMPLLWHFYFHATRELPELLVQGHQKAYIRSFINRVALNAASFKDEDIARFARAYASDEQLRSGFEFYRAFPETARFNASRIEPLKVPITLVGGDHATAPLNARVAAALREKGAQSVTAETVRDSGHFVADEQPEQVAGLIERHAAP